MLAIQVPASEAWLASSHTDLGASMLPEGIEPFMTLEAGTALIACTGHMDKRSFPAS